MKRDRIKEGSAGERWRRKLMILAGWLILWQFVSILCGNSIFLVGPWETTKALLGHLREGDFVKTVFLSAGRILTGIGLGIAAGGALAVCSYRLKLAEEIVKPFMTMLKAIPVASFAVLLLIWWGSSFLSICISFLVVFPQIYLSMLSGLKSTDHKLLEMSSMYDVPLWGRIMYVYRPALKPFLESSFKIAAGMAWKSGVAAEVIGTPRFSVGNGLYLSKVHFDTAGVFAWTAVTILLSVVMEKILLWALKRLMDWEPAVRKRRESTGKRTEAPLMLQAKNLWKSYPDQTVIRDYSESFVPGQIRIFATPSGSGKTTLFRLLGGLEQPDSGSVVCNGRVILLFQDNRLCDDYSAVKNVALVCGSEQQARKWLERVLPPDSLDKPCRQLSGGMRRRVALIRAFVTGADCFLLDEPFTGLDEANREKVMELIRETAKEKIVLIAGHDPMLTGKTV